MKDGRCQNKVSFFDTFYLIRHGNLHVIFERT